MCLTHIWKYMQEKGVLPDVFSQIARTLGFARVEEAIEYLFDLDEELFGEDPVAMDEKDLELLTISVNPTRLKNNPLPLSEEEISRLYRNIMGKWSR